MHPELAVGASAHGAQGVREGKSRCGYRGGLPIGRLRSAAGGGRLRSPPIDGESGGEDGGRSRVGLTGCLSARPGPVDFQPKLASK